MSDQRYCTKLNGEIIDLDLTFEEAHETANIYNNEYDGEYLLEVCLYYPEVDPDFHRYAPDVQERILSKEKNW